MRNRNSKSSIKKIELSSFRSKFSTSKNNIFSKYIQHKSNCSIIPAKTNNNLNSGRNNSHAQILNCTIREFCKNLFKVDKSENKRKIQSPENRQTDFFYENTNIFKGYKKRNNDTNNINIKKPLNKIPFTSNFNFSTYHSKNSSLSKYCTKYDKNISKTLKENMQNQEKAKMANLDSVASLKNLTFLSLFQSNKFKELNEVFPKNDPNKLRNPKNENTNKKGENYNMKISKNIQKDIKISASKKSKSIDIYSNLLKKIDNKISFNKNVKLMNQEKLDQSNSKKIDINLSNSSFFDLEENLDNIKLYRIDHYAFQPKGENDEQIEI